MFSYVLVGLVWGEHSMLLSSQRFLRVSSFSLCFLVLSTLWFGLIAGSPEAISLFAVLVSSS